jgi:hypothetical protein
MIHLNKIAQFQLFCLEHYKYAEGIKGRDALNIFNRHLVFNFISDNYEVLHTQGKQYIISEISSFINNHQ